MSSASEKTLPTETSLIRAHTLMALAMAGWSALLGVILAAKFSYPDMMSGHPWFTWGRIRYAHTQGIFFGWLGNAFLAFLYFAVPRLAERPVLSRRLGWLLFFLWNFLMVLPGWVLLHAGRSQPLEWGEFPREIDAIAVASLALCLAQFVWPLLRASWARLYVSGWYILGGLVFTTLAYPVGNMVPEFEPGARGATYSGLWIHDAIGLYVTPLALAIAYLVIPLSTRRPIFSHFLSLIGFWLLFLVYPLNGTHHYVFSSIPMEAQKAAIVASVYLGVDVLLVVTNLLLSLRGQGGTVARDIPLRFVWVGVICYLVVSLQGSLHALMPVNRFVHFTDWVIGHAHLALVGFASFTAIGGLLFVHQRLPGVRYHPGLAGFSFWMLGVSLAFMVLDLTVAGLIQGQLWHADVPWMDSVRASQPYWLIRSVSGSGILVGFITLFLSMVVGPIQQVSERPGATHEDSEPATEASSPSEADPVGLGWLTSAHVILAIAGVGFFALSFLALAVWPNRVLQEKILADLPSHLVAPSAGESRGRAIFIREGCGNCHSQLIRFTEDDVRRFGPPSQAWESARDFPQLWGTRRIGPDLARERGKRSRDWHLTHLFNPRYTVPDSNMPRYPWLFEGSASHPTREASDLVDYLESLGRDAEMAGRSGPQPLPGFDPEEEKRRGMFCDCGIPRLPGPAPRITTEMEASERERFQRLGEEVFARECRGCHGVSGSGEGPASESLLPRPRDLRDARFSDAALSDILWKGIRGSAMPGWHELPQRELRGLAVYIQSRGDRNVPEAPLSVDEARQARLLFEKNCQVCHGPEGGGNPLSPTVLAPAPSNFQQIRPTTRRAETVLAEGIPGTSMAGWKEKLAPAERSLLARFVRSLYRGNE